jgi:hypothetical protein
VKQVEFNVSSVNLDGGYMKRSFVCSQWFLLSSETTASRVWNNRLDNLFFPSNQVFGIIKIGVCNGSLVSNFK